MFDLRSVDAFVGTVLEQAFDNIVAILASSAGQQVELVADENDVELLARLGPQLRPALVYRVGYVEQVDEQHDMNDTPLAADQLADHVSIVVERRAQRRVHVDQLVACGEHVAALTRGIAEFAVGERLKTWRRYESLDPLVLTVQRRTAAAAHLRALRVCRILFGEERRRRRRRLD